MNFRLSAESLLSPGISPFQWMGVFPSVTSPYFTVLLSCKRHPRRCTYLNHTVDSLVGFNIHGVTHETITPFNKMNVSFPLKVSWHPLGIPLPCFRPSPPAATDLLSVPVELFVSSRVFYKWDRVVSVHLCLTPFTQHNYFRIQSCQVSQ